MENIISEYQKSRKAAGYSQEDAASLLGMATRTLSGNESGATDVQDDVCARMIVLYKDERLGYQHLQNNPVARRYLPPLEDKTLSQAALSLISAAKNYENKQNLMIDVCADGKVENAEAGQWAEVNDAIRGLIRAAFTLLYANKD